MSDDGIVNIHGKSYITVAKRVQDFRSDYGNDVSIETEVLCAADLVLVKATIKNEEGRILASDHAEEERGSTNINKTSAVENCCTSAIGRALSALGYGGTEYASADEVTNAINNQAIKSEHEFMKAHMDAVRDNWDSVYAIQYGIANDDLQAASEAWGELTTEAKTNLWRATTKGGIFTTHERDVIKSTEFREARLITTESAA